MRTAILALILTIVCTGSAGGADDVYMIYLVRHAEKQPDGSKDPALTETGKKRAEQLAAWFQDRPIEDVWSSDFKRTRDTVKPLLQKMALELKFYDPGDQNGLVSQLSSLRRNALIVGHSNTIPELARMLCNCVIADMHETEHDRLIVISVTGGETKTETLLQGELLVP